MRTETVVLDGATAGTHRSLTALRFGDTGARPKFYLQTGLHADEIPGLLVAQHLRAKLVELEAAGRLLGEIVLVPAANPIGLAQQVSGSHIGRFCLTDGQNFNRGFPQLVDGLARRIDGRLGAVERDNTTVIRAALLDELAAQPAISEHQSLKHALLRHAVDADYVLDLHCDTEAVVHVYTGTALVERGRLLARLLGAHALLVAEASGDDPFDEACSRPWWELAARFPRHPIGLSCFAATVELRGAADVDHATAADDARALVDFMIVSGVVSGTAPLLPEPRCEPTPLSGSEPLVADRSGIVVFHRAVGEQVRQGDVIADLIDPISAASVALRAPTTGVFYARAATRWAYPGLRLGKIAGRRPSRVGPLLSP